MRQLGTGQGGAIFQVNGTLTVTDSTFNSNTAADGVSIHSAGDVAHVELNFFAPAPAAPTGLTARAASDSQIALSWADNASNESSYSVERSDNGVDGWTVVTSTLAANTTSCLDGRLAVTQQHCYRVRCGLGGSASDHSNAASATTSACVGDAISGWWKYRYFGDGTTIFSGAELGADPDGDGVSNLQEYLAGTDPTDATGALKVRLSSVGASSRRKGSSADGNRVLAAAAR